MTFSPNGAAIPEPVLLSRDRRPVYTLSNACPLCYGALTLRQTRDGRRYYIACSRRPCDYTASYEPVLEQLRDRIAKLEAELEFTRMQARVAEEGVS